MNISRRKFLEAGALFTVAAGATLAIPSIIKGQTNKDVLSYETMRPYENSNDLLSTLTKSDFERLLKTQFAFASPVLGTRGLTLVHVEDLASNKEGIKPNGDVGFSLLFRGQQTNLTQGTYQVTHASLGTFQLFIVPVNSNRSSSRSYEAVINRLYS